MMKSILILFNRLADMADMVDMVDMVDIVQR